MKTGAGRAGGTSGFYGVAYRSRSARRAPQMASIGRLGSSALAGWGFCAPDPQPFSRQNVHCRAGRPPRIMKTGAGRAGGTSGFYGVAYRSRSARRAPQMASIGRLGSSALAGRGFVRPIPNHFHGKSDVHPPPDGSACSDDTATSHPSTRQNSTPPEPPETRQTATRDRQGPHRGSPPLVSAEPIPAIPANAATRRWNRSARPSTESVSRQRVSLFGP